MASQFDTFNDAILGELSQIGIEILNDLNNKNEENSLSKAIYDMTRDSSVNSSENSNDD